MHITRRTWVSAGLVSAILAGGISVTAAASAGRIDRGVGRDAETGEAGVGSGTGPARTPEADGPGGAVEGADPTAPPRTDPSDVPPVFRTTPPDDTVVSKEVNPDPGEVTTYWTEQRMQEAKPFPMPAVEGPVDVNE
ncbi:hypothetical protein [Streptosporangium sp. NPDC051022]|uniref:hypothetical protein n=1 Tax=Streptosporangium sp. NPDC051022 TaxID=3155752 RepID=UPI0034372F0B